MSIISRLLLIGLLSTGTFAVDIELTRLAGADGQTTTVTVPASVALLHTRQFCDADPVALLRAMALPREKTVKLNVVAATLVEADAARQAIRSHFPDNAQPAVSVVIGALPKPGATVGFDAVVAASAGERTTTPAIFISGQAEDGASVADATMKTLASLKETLAFVDCEPGNISQAKCFLTPMSAAPEVSAEFSRAFPGLDTRLVFVEWKSKLPIEIELVVVAKKSAPSDAPAVEYLTPPGKQASPNFARVVRVNHGDLIFIGDIASRQEGDGEAQVLSIFEQLKDILDRTGSDLRHLAKATYYVSDDDASGKLNALRPRFFDPSRPPAASKALVPGVGVTDRSITIDMIGVKPRSLKP